ncbi:MAG: AMP-binding protein, partial [Panacagrimonas sp.]
MSNIQSVLEEKRLFPPSAEFAAKARLDKDKLAALCAAAEKDPVGFWAEQARKHIAWQTPFRTVLDDSDAPNYRWFTDGRTNASANCLDRHLATKADKIAIRFEGDKGDTKNWTYRALHAEVCKLANGLKSLGVKKGDRVVLYMPHTPEAVMAMQACARIGAVHSIVFGGFSSGSLRDRIEDAGAKVVITADGNSRGGNLIELKKAVNEALSSGCKTIEKVVVFKRTGQDVAFDTKRDVWWHELVARQSSNCDPEWVESEHPLFLLYTSGSTGKPKGIQHSTGGYMVGTHMSCEWVFDLKDSDVFWCTADVGWITGHSYVCYGPLSCGATILMFEGVPT